MPDTIEDEWITDIQKLNERLADYTTRRNQAANAFDLRYADTIMPKGEAWEKCERVLAKRDIVQVMSQGW